MLCKAIFGQSCDVIKSTEGLFSLPRQIHSSSASFGQDNNQLLAVASQIPSSSDDTAKAPE